jgi:hypothetical protein
MDDVLARRYARHVLSPVYRILDEGGELASGAVQTHGQDDALGESSSRTSRAVSLLAIRTHD